MWCHWSTMLPLRALSRHIRPPDAMKERVRRPRASDAGVAVNYCYEWNDLTKEMREPYDSQTARARHERGALYTAALGGPSSPHTLVEVRLETGWIGVHFLDAQLRRWTTYSFDTIDDERLFLRQYRRSEYDDAGKQTATEMMNFSEGGVVTIQRANQLDKTVSQYEVQTDVSSNWEPIPAFGKYELISRFDRSGND